MRWREVFGVANGNGRNKLGKLEVCREARFSWMRSRKCRLPADQAAARPADGYFIRPAATPGSRWMCASRRPPANIEQAIADRKLREDLYYRLSAFTVHVPALQQKRRFRRCWSLQNRLARRYDLPARTRRPPRRRVNAIHGRETLRAGKL
jgi:hypothetical protein